MGAYKVKVVLEPQKGFFKQDLLSSFGVLQKLAQRISSFVFEYLVIRGLMGAYILFITWLAILLLLVSLLFLFLGLKEVHLTILTYVYLMFMLIVLPLLVYFADVYQAMQLKRAMNLGVREKVYPKNEKGSEEAFEWTTSSLALLHAIRYGLVKRPSWTNFADVAGVTRSSARDTINKLLKCGIIQKDEKGEYRFSGVDFEVYYKRGKNTNPVEKVTEQSRARFQYLFRVLCFVAF